MRLLLALLVATIATGCVSYHPVRQPSGSLLNLNMPHTQFEPLGLSSGEACQMVYLFFFGDDRYYYDRALRDAIGKRGGDILIQTSTDVRLRHFFVFYYERCLLVRGMVFRIHKVKNRREPSKKRATLGSVDYPRLSPYDLRKDFKKYYGERFSGIFRTDRFIKFPKKLRYLKKSGGGLMKATISETVYLVVVPGRNRAKLESRIGKLSKLVYIPKTTYKNNMPVVEMVDFDTR